MRGIFFALAALVLFLVLSGYRVLVWQQRVPQGQIVKVADWGDVQGDALVCRYFSGRSISVNVFGYSPYDIMGKSECPFLVRPE